MEIIFSPSAIEDLNYWKQTHDKKTLQKIRTLIESIQNDPFKGIGKPEPLKHEMKGMWSRRITREHRLIYEVTSSTIVIHALKEHY